MRECAHSVHIAPLAANHLNPKPQERNRLLAKLSPLGFPFGLYMACNIDYSHCYPFSRMLHSLKPYISLGLLSFTPTACSESLYELHSIVFFHVHTVLKAWNRWQRSVAIQMVCLLSASPETTTQSGLITVDSKSLHTYCIVTFLLRQTDHFPLCNGCFITFEEPFTGPTWTLLAFIRQADPQIHRNSESALRVHVTHDLTAFAFIQTCCP